MFGPVTADEAAALVAAAASGLASDGPNVPWAVVARQGEGLTAVVGPMLSSGLFWSSSEGSLIVSTDPATATYGTPVVDDDHVRACLEGLPGPQRAPFLGVHRLTPAVAAVWATPTTPPSTADFLDLPERPDGVDEPHAAYLAALDDVCADLTRRGALPTRLALSAGLDSTALAAAFVRAGPVRGLTYRPRPGAAMWLADGAWADEGPLLASMVEACGGRLTVEDIVNDPAVAPLAAAAEAGTRGGVPVFNPANQPWLDRMRGRAADAPWLVTGANGNAAFSFDHGYAVRRPPWRRSRPSSGVLARFGVGGAASPAVRTRADYLRWLARRATSLPAAANPAATRGTVIVDPFTAPSIVRLAARITPRQWRAHGPRGFARQALTGRVPDDIRLRRGRGQQGRDAWSVVSGMRAEYLDRIASIRNVPGLAGVTVDGLAAHVGQWPWGTSEPPPWREQVAVDRLLALAAFAQHEWSGRPWPSP